MAEKIRNTKKYIAMIAVFLCNIVLIVTVVLFTIKYQRDIYDRKEGDQLEGFCNTVETMKQISAQYLTTELDNAEAWAAYILHEHMTLDGALSYISTIDKDTPSEAHIVDMDTYDAWSSVYTNGKNSISYYKETSNLIKTSGSPYVGSNIKSAQNIFNGKSSILCNYLIKEESRRVISLGTRVTLSTGDGADKDYLLLRVIPLETIKSIWLFPTSFRTAQIGMITTGCDYIVPSNAMRSENFMEFVRFYNFYDDYCGADAVLAPLKTESNGLLTLNDSKGQPCYWYYSKLDNFEDADVIGYIPTSSLSYKVEGLSIVYVVAAAMFLLIILDVGYILIINKRLRATAKIANQANKSKTRFLSTMSHDIRTPLNAVLGMTELAQSRTDDPEYVKECLAKITVSGNHLLTLINDILEISRVESGKTKLTPEPFNVRLFISNLESLTRSQAVGHGLSFECNIGELPYENLIGDRLRLTQVYLNLLNNSVKYTKAGGNVSLTVYEENPEENGNVTLTCVISDNGTGMSKEFQKTMYESFARVADARVDKTEGTGLGLSIVHHMVDLMDGTIDCESEVDVGTTFKVRIPLKAAAEDELPQGDVQNEDTVSDLLGLRILIAEDNDINWEIIRSLLTERGIVCERAENGRECVDFLLAAAPGTYDLVFMDVQMPYLNGLDATREIRASERDDLRKIPIAAMTADAFAEDVQECIDAGMNAHISKPIQLDKVLITIRLLLREQKNQNKAK